MIYPSLSPFAFALRNKKLQQETMTMIRGHRGSKEVNSFGLKPSGQSPTNLRGSSPAPNGLRGQSPSPYGRGQSPSPSARMNNHLFGATLTVVENPGPLNKNHSMAAKNDTIVNVNNDLELVLPVPALNLGPGSSQGSSQSSRHTTFSL